jgi:hypothetical protein
MTYMVYAFDGTHLPLHMMCKFNDSMHIVVHSFMNSKLVVRCQTGTLVVQVC